METKETKFSYVYNHLKEQIVSGRLGPGSRLLSSRRLCEEFHVGIRTITDVLNSLKEDGFIEIQPRRAPVVSFTKEGRDGSSPALVILSQRDQLLQVYETMIMVMPPLLAFSSREFSLESLPCYEQYHRNLQKKMSSGNWRLISSIYHAALENSGNPLFCDLYSKFEFYGQVGFFVDELPDYTGISLRNYFSGDFDYLANVLGTSDITKKHRQLKDIYQKVYSSVSDSLAQLENLFSGSPIPAGRNTGFSWNPDRGRDYYYMRIVQDLESKIGAGVYPYDSFLPPEAELAKQYGVSVSTVRKALSVLEQRGLSRTLNAKGTQVLVPDDSGVPRRLQNKEIRHAIMRYLYSLQFMALIIRPSVLRAAPFFRDSDIASLDKKYESQDAVWFENILSCLIERMDLHPMRVILTEANRLTHWGYYLTLYPHKNKAYDVLNQLGRSAYRHFRNDDLEGLANGLADGYCHILKAVQNYMMDKYHFTEALDVQIPNV